MSKRNANFNVADLAYRTAQARLDKELEGHRRSIAERKEKLAEGMRGRVDRENAIARSLKLAKDCGAIAEAIACMQSAAANGEDLANIAYVYENEVDQHAAGRYPGDNSPDRGMYVNDLSPLKEGAQLGVCAWARNQGLKVTIRVDLRSSDSLRTASVYLGW